MATYNSIEDFLDSLENAISVSLVEAGDKVAKKMSQTIYRLVYATYSPHMYNRTNRLLNSPQIIHKDKTSITVGLRDITYRDITNDVDSLETVIDMFSSGQILAKGTSLTSNPPVLIYRPAVPLSQELTNDLNELDKIFIELLKEKGF